MLWAAEVAVGGRTGWELDTFCSHANQPVQTDMGWGWDSLAGPDHIRHKVAVGEFQVSEHRLQSVLTEIWGGGL